MPGLLTSFGCCLAKSGGVGLWEGQEGLGLNLLCVAGPITALALGPKVCTCKHSGPSQILLTPPLYDVPPLLHAAHECTCDEAQAKVPFQV